MEALGREPEPLSSEKLKAVVCNLKEERSNTIYELFYEKDESSILPKFLENQIYAYIELIKEVEKRTKKFKYPISVAFEDDDNNVYYCINNPEENCYITLYPNPINEQSPKAYIHSYTRKYNSDNEGYRRVVETEKFIAKSGLRCFEDFLKIVRPCEAYINSVLAKMS
ncbi:MULTISPECIES: hypothetical protein [unclassified Candidatus Nanosynbacter]|uniref:hypothetical protein n=1 Tax=unclassified Candidatus Nanosynbacter TaxID=2725944 RepID=UPI001FB6E76E|nr:MULTISPECIES: hypothetical protein [unclassified Candidatus Nanosynbacter]MCJ1963184.1 hypothetical protein [Candidatus Nanosynbacter sp. TM7-033]UOG67673.1 hypothetical protein LRM46_02585 [Candidatus Nanosynbacter sp. HMT-352]